MNVSYFINNWYNISFNFIGCFFLVYTDGVDSQPPVSPIGILRESPVPADSKWFEENMNDFSLSSFLGQLEANCEQVNGRRSRSPRCVSTIPV